LRRKVCVALRAPTIALLQVLADSYPRFCRPTTLQPMVQPVCHLSRQFPARRIVACRVLPDLAHFAATRSHPRGARPSRLAPGCTLA